MVGSCEPVSLLRGGDGHRAEGMKATESIAAQGPTSRKEHEKWRPFLVCRRSVPPTRLRHQARSLTIDP
jgi:hypothetical protein